MAKSNGVPIAPPRGNKKHLKDDDLFVCTLNGKTHKVAYKDIKELVFFPPSQWHIKDVSGGTCTALNIDRALDMAGNQVSGPANSFVISAGEERIVVGNDVRFTESTGNWNFGDRTDTKRQMSFDYLCKGCVNFNGDIQHLDVTEWAFDISYMFDRCYKFNQSVSHFNTKNVNTVRAVFQAGPNDSMGVFNQPVPWNLDNCQNIMLAFQKQPVFNQDLSSWSGNRTISMHSVFRSCDAFVGTGLEKWKNTGVNTSLKYTFSDAIKFNPSDLSGWDMSKVVNAQSTFELNSDRFAAGVRMSFQGNGIENWKFNSLENTTPDGTGPNNGDSAWAMFSACTPMAGKNLSKWCVPKRTTEPKWFTWSVPGVTHPVWGTCP